MTPPTRTDFARRLQVRAWQAARWAAPLAVCLAVIGCWEATVRHYDLKPYELAAPSRIAATIRDNGQELGSAWLVTLQTMAVALGAAIVLGVTMGALFASSRLLATCLFPYTVILQVTPLVAIAPFLVLWIGPERVWLTQVTCAWIVAFFPILSNTTIGLRTIDRGLADLFALYDARRLQRLRWLLAPSALPYFLAGLKVSANLALIGAIVAEFVIGPETAHPGLASVILASQYRQDTPMMFAALVLVSATGIAIYLVVSALSWALLHRWHESATGLER